MTAFTPLQPHAAHGDGRRARRTARAFAAPTIFARSIATFATFATFATMGGAFGPSRASAAPIFTNVAESYGLGPYAGAIRLLADSENPNQHYLLPAAFTSSVVVEPLFGTTLPGELRRWPGLVPGSAHFSFLLLPRIDLLGAALVASTLVSAQRANPEFFVGPLACLDADLEMGGIPRTLYDRVTIMSVATDLPDIGGRALEVPPGYAYHVTITSRDPDTLQSALLRLGVKGAAKLNCEGYIDDAATAGLPTPIRQGIPVDATFGKLVRGE